MKPNNVIAILTGLLLTLACAGSAAAASPDTDWFSRAKLGVFMHFLPSPQSGPQQVEQFDVKALTDQLAEMGAGYFVLTLGQNSGWLNSPNAAYDRRTGYAPGERCSKRDLPLDLHEALKAKGIRLMLYLPCQVPNQDRRAQKAYGLPEGPKDQPIDLAAAEKWSEVIQEWSDRYGDKVAGWWFDGGYAHIGFNDAIAARYAAAAKHGYPKAIVTFNPGVKVIRWTKAEDYTAGELNEPLSVVPANRWLDGSQWHALTYVGDTWGRRNTRFADAQWIEWARKVFAKGGVITLDMGPNYDAAKGPVGSLAEAQVKQVKAITAAVRPRSELSAPPGETADSAVESLPLRDNPKTRLAMPARPAPGLILHVAPSGSDSGDGTAAKPFATLERARDEIRSLRKGGALPKGGVEVRVHGGAYQVSRTFSLAAGDSGTEAAPVIFQAAPDEQPVFRGGSRLTDWRQLLDGDGYPQLPPEVRAKVWIADLRSVGLTSVIPLKLGGFASGNGFRTHPAHELFFNGQAMTLARGPNEGFLRIKDVAVKDGTKGYDRQGSKTGKFFAESDRLRRWANEPELMLYGYWFWDWADSYERVESIDAEQRLITLAKPWHTYGFSVGAPFHAVNALSELDQAGEWYLDRAGLKALLFPPSNPRAATVELSTFAEPMLTMENVSWVEFRGVEWELGSADAIRVRGGAHCLFAGCVVKHFAGNGVEPRGGQQHGLRSCDIYSMGRGGALISGGNRKTLTPGGHFVENCDIHDLSRIDHTYTPAVILDGVGNRVAHCRLHDIRSSAMRVGGNDHLIEYNEIFNVVTESDDQGGADMFGNPTFRGNVYRFNYWHHIGNWRATGEQPKCGQAGIRLDDAICGTRIYGNVFEHCSAGKHGFGGVQIHGGKDNLIENNLFIHCAAMVSCSPWDEKRWRTQVANALDSREVDRALYLQRYPQMAELSENANLNRIQRNLGWRCGEVFRRAPKNLDAQDNLVLQDHEFTWNPHAFQLERPGFDRIPFEEIGLHRDEPFRLK